MRWQLILVILPACASTPSAPAPSQQQAPVVVVSQPSPESREGEFVPSVMACGEANCAAEAPVCCLHMDLSSGSLETTTSCTASWRACRVDDDHLFRSCRRQDECPSGQHCCHFEAAGDRCVEDRCGGVQQVVCQSKRDCPPTDEGGVELARCAIEIGAHVFDHYGYCVYGKDNMVADSSE